jgi:hypothetical protein
MGVSPGSSTVEVTLSSLDRARTKLRLVHTGLDDGAPRHLHDDGWNRFLSRLHAAMGDRPVPEYPSELPADRLTILTRDE